MKTAKRRASRPPAPPGEPARLRIVRAAFSLFNEQGFNQTSMLEIATRAQVSKRDLYAFYANKHAVLVDCVSERARAMRRPFERGAPPESRAALAARLIEIGKSILHGVSRPEVLMVYRLTIAESGSAPELARILDENGRAANHKALADLLARAQGRGLIDGGDPAALVARYFTVLWGDLLIRLLMRLRDAPTADEMEARARAATEAIMPSS